ncbi:quinoprotein dehydrogenase-associated probable ABC transporter substrate-binding protein [Palleronia marisminoris]|uniref:Bacterial extracellular solute-binding proteins, family 3 n=1 Tax=Palleronia marisminoris TaxID=315423 RepID=A0A1Y5SD30_9RHOB|nr:substrate-binding domain-containing protein [Palleronia marisminoris]SFG72009.1 quinoprotein dehydrogenase-associated probable ABC transporter substrate-binding protein [Palleronia marisminoris]SLN36870.1 Bacterial extracellular solute-binding proteins, family 3 [Palleronia marisminoris]
MCLPRWKIPAWVEQARHALLAIAIAVAAPHAAVGQETGVGDAFELVDPDTLRVCADPRNLPFSDEAGEGFENALAELVAEKLGRPSVDYTFFPQGVGFVRNTLQAFRCDIIMGYAQGDELVQNTNPYYQSAYALIVPPESELADVTRLDDPRLQGKRIGVVAGTPPATSLAKYGLMGTARPYHLMVDTRASSPVHDMITDLAADEIDAALAWGPMAGYYAQQQTPPLKVIPLTSEVDGPRMTYRITMGVRPSDQEWKRELNDLIRENQAEIDALLLDYGVPLLDEQGQPITR